MKHPVHFFVGSAYMGSGQRDMLNHDPRHSPPLSVAFFCQRCGEVWARSALQDQAYECWSMLCEKHTVEYPFQVPGSTWMPWDRGHNESLSDEMLKREFIIHLAHYDRFKDQLK